MVRTGRMDNKRKHERIEQRVKSEVHAEDGMTYSSTVDLSEGGMFISTPDPLEQGTKITLALQTPDGDEINVQGTVKWTRSGDNDEEPNGMGVEFSDATDDEMELIRKIIH